MATNKGRVEVKVATDVEMSEVEALEKRLAAVKNNKIKIQLEADTKRLEEVNTRLNELKEKKIKLEAQATVDDSEIQKVQGEIETLKSEQANLQIKVSKGELDQAENEVNELDGKEINLQLATQNIMAGLQTVKQGVGELAGNMGEVLESAGRMEQTETFLAMNMGADKAKQKLEEIRSVTDQLPGDDVTLQNLLSQAALKDASMTTSAFTQMGSAAADYMAAMQNFGKTSTETQQDLMNYILAGNTAEIERSPILQAHVDKLKEGTTVQERAKLLQEALTAEGWNGIASQDIYNNKQQQFNDMLERGKTNLGGMFLEGSEGAIDYIMQLDNATNGLLGMGIAAADMAGGPMFDAITGIGQMAVAYNALKEAKVVQTAVDWALAAAEWAAASPMLIIAVLIAAIIGLLILLYMNSEEVRNAIDSLGQSLLDLGSYIVDSVVGAFNYIDQILTDSLNSFNNWGNNLINTIVNTARNAVNGFTSWIGGMYNALVTELNNMLSAVGRWASQLWNRFKQAGINAVNSFLAGLGIASPGIMQRSLVYEIQEMGERVPEESRGLIKNINSLGSDVVNEFGTPNLDMDYSLNNTLSSNAGNNTGAFRDINITVEGDVDSDDRIQQIVDAVTRSLAFDNKTAGRII